MTDGKTQSGNPAPSSYQQLLDDLPRTGPGTSGVSMWQRARSAPAMRDRIEANIGPNA